MDELKIGDPVEVIDPALIMLAQFMPPGTRPLNHGYVSELHFGDDDEVMVEFPIGDDPMDEHSQISPYPRHMLKKRVE